MFEDEDLDINGPLSTSGFAILCDTSACPGPSYDF